MKSTPNLEFMLKIKWKNDIFEQTREFIFDDFVEHVKPEP